MGASPAPRVPEVSPGRGVEASFAGSVLRHDRFDDAPGTGSAALRRTPAGHQRQRQTVPVQPGVAGADHRVHGAHGRCCSSDVDHRPCECAARHAADEFDLLGWDKRSGEHDRPVPAPAGRVGDVNGGGGLPVEMNPHCRIHRDNPAVGHDGGDDACARTGSAQQIARDPHGADGREEPLVESMAAQHSQLPVRQGSQRGLEGAGQETGEHRAGAQIPWEVRWAGRRGGDGGRRHGAMVMALPRTAPEYGRLVDKTRLRRHELRHAEAGC